MDALSAEADGYADGEFDGYTGAEYDAYSDCIPEEFDVYYRGGYSLGWLDGLAHRRREDTL